jgi:uncharacterized protein (DUF2141 family)
MFKNVFPLVMLAFLVGPKISFTQNNTCTLQIQITELRSSKGKIRLQLFNKDKVIVHRESKLIHNNQCLFTISNLCEGNYAIRYFHDENSNNKLDTNWLGIPTEGYGFSNNATGMFGPPPFEEQLFKIISNKTIYLIINY